MADRAMLADIAEKYAKLPFHGAINGQAANIQPIVDLFPKWNVVQADGLWCAAFVYYCCVKAGFDFPYSPAECVSCSLAGCGGWEDFALNNPRFSTSSLLISLPAVAT